ncbi:MAG: flavodoxin domain-containing protein [Chitinispirillaceae bacterium]|nr:flavodoxin domain-containing protein [Chitinispirillaceae bacterium]
MRKNVLIVYATRSGTTREIAETVAEILRKSGFSTDVQPAKKVRSIESADAVVLGTAVRMGMLMPEVMRFVKKHRNKLVEVPVAAFAVCLAVKDDTPENRKAVAGYLNPLKKEISLVSEAVLAGAIHYARLGVFARFVIQKMVKAQEGDFREIEKITEWSTDVARRFRSS